MKTLEKKMLTIFVLSILFSFPASAQKENQPLLKYWGNVEQFLTEQARHSFMLINEILDKNLPSAEESLIRKSALSNLDAILHDPRFDTNEALYQFIQGRIQKVNEALKQPAGTGLEIYKLYNHSFIIRTQTVTVAFDLFRGGKRNESPYIPDSLMKEIVEKCDIMFVTHNHGDHADKAVADMFVKAGKKVIVPSGLWENESSGIEQLRADKVLHESIDLGRTHPLKAKIIPGHQGNLANNVYVVTTPEGYTVAHTGDQSNKEDFKWVSTIKDSSPIDVLLTICWYIPLEELVNSFDPEWVITGHENEMNHSIDHREPYWLNEIRTKNIKQKKVFMTWGESFSLPRK